MKIGIEVEDKALNNVDFTCVEKGNPGIGGSGFEALLLGIHLAEHKEYEVTFYHQGTTNRYPNNCHHVIITSYQEALETADNNKEDVYICNTNHGSAWYEKLRTLSLKVIIWSSCYLDNAETRDICKTKNVIRVVHVSQEQYEAYIDDDVIEKSCYIYNMIEPDCYPLRDCIENLPNSVTYVGSLVPQKGFGYLASIWPELEKQIPSVELHVIGTGQLYDRNQKLGPYGIAEESFEKSFMPFLCKEDGTVKENVHFHGLLGNEKNDIFYNTKVGVVNPLALTETFCICAVEMEAAGIPIVTRRKHGLLSTVKHGETGLLFTNKKAFIKYTACLLSDSEINEKYGKTGSQFVKEEFSSDAVMKEWIALLKRVEKDPYGIEDYRKPVANFTNDRKWVKRNTRFFRFVIKMRFFPSTLQWDAFVWRVGSMLKKGIRKLMGK